MDVSYCHAVTDDGIKGLCSDEYGLESEMKKMGQCKFLHTLKMKETKVTKTGVKLALEHLPELRTFEFPRSVQILAELRRVTLERGDFKTYPFTEFDCDEFEDDYYDNRVSYESGSLRLAANICPNVNEVQIKLQLGVTDIELKGLLELKTLRELNISGDFSQENCQITFDGGLLPLLKAFGSFLQQLTLYKLDICLNIRYIAAYCPNLEDLTLDDNSRYSLEDGSLYKEAKLKKLKKLVVSCNVEANFSSKMLALLLSSPELKSLAFFHCDVLTDAVLEKSSLFHEFRNLERLHLYSCNFVTKKGIDIILNEVNPLRKLFVRECDLISIRKCERWKNKARKENLDIEIKI